MPPDIDLPHPPPVRPPTGKNADAPSLRRTGKTPYGRVRVIGSTLPAARRLDPKRRAGLARTLAVTRSTRRSPSRRESGPALLEKFAQRVEQPDVGQVHVDRRY